MDHIVGYESEDITKEILPGNAYARQAPAGHSWALSFESGKLFCGLLRAKGRVRVVTMRPDAKNAATSIFRFSNYQLAVSYITFLEGHTGEKVVAVPVPAIMEEDRATEMALRRVEQISRERRNRDNVARAVIVQKALDSLNEPKKRLSRQAGSVLLMELLFCCLILEIIFLMAAPSAVQMLAYQNQAAAKANVTLIRNSEAALALCTANQNQTPCSGVSQLIPTSGTILNYGSYKYIFVQSGSSWNYTATPVSPALQAFWTDSTGVIRCNTGTVTNTSPVCPY